MSNNETDILIDKVYHYYVKILDNSGIIREKKEFKSETLEVVAQNKDYLVVNDYCFTSISKVKSDHCSDLAGASISLFANDRIWGNGIFYTRYSLKPIKASKIRGEIEKAIDKKYGYFTGKIDLSIITDKKEVA